MILLLFFAFLSGLVTILAPCIWPLLPIILSTSIGAASHKKPLGVTLGIMVSFLVFTLFISALIRIFHFDPNTLRLIAVVVIGVLGLTMVIPKLSRMFEVLISRLTAVFGSAASQRNGFTGGFLTGLTLGIVWSPCAGPILAAIAALAATGKVNTSVFLVALSYVIGVGIPLFLFAYGGQQVVLKSRAISKYTLRIQQIFGVVMIVSAFLIYKNYDVLLQTKLLNAIPFLNQTVNGFENRQDVKQELNALRGSQTTNTETPGLFNENKSAPDFIGITHWLNTDKPLTIADLKGKVVLVDFWTYTCINCIRTLPHVTSWYDKYKDKGFVVVGVHTPEFAFEKETGNVENAIKQYSIHYPVGQDNNYATWNNYQNEFWPAEYLIDAKGNVRRTHFGEGEYDQTELAIQTLLKENGQNVGAQTVNMPDQTPQGNKSPETYLGSKRMQYLFPNGSAQNGTQNFTLGTDIPLNSFSFGGQWTIDSENATTGKSAVLLYHFRANRVFLVLRPGTSTMGKVSVFLDGKLVNQSVSGKDVVSSSVTIDTDRLYDLIDMHGNPGEHVIRLEFQTPGIQAFAFTFG